MPQISQLPFDHSVISLSLERDRHRSAGVHLGAIIRDRLITAGIIRQRIRKGTEDDDSHLQFQKGFLWESMVTEYIQTPEWQRIEWDWWASKHLDQAIADSVVSSGGYIVRPGEQEMDGIYLTPDAINTRLLHVEEWKATAIRSKNFSLEAKKPEWLWQAASYARKFGMTRAIIRVWHLADMPPVVNQYCIDWTAAEIEENWRQIMEHYTHMKSRGK